MKATSKYSRFVTNPPPRSVMESEKQEKVVAFDLKPETRNETN